MLYAMISILNTLHWEITQTVNQTGKLLLSLNISTKLMYLCDNMPTESILGHIII